MRVCFLKLDSRGVTIAHGFELKKSIYFSKYISYIFKKLLKINSLDCLSKVFIFNFFF